MVQRIFILFCIIPLFAACGRRGITVPAIVGAFKGSPSPIPSVATPPPVSVPVTAPTQTPATPPPSSQQTSTPPPAALTGSISASSTSMSFGNLQIGQSAQLSVTFTNNHNAAVLVQFVSTFNSNSLEIIAQDCQGSTLQPGGQCRFTVRFQPNAQLCEQYQVYLSYTAGGSTTLYSPVVNVTGCGAPSNPSLTGSVTLASNSMNFGNVRVGQSVQTTGFYFQNNHNVAINTVRIIGLTNSPYFVSLNSDGCTNSVLQPGQVCPFSVTFAPGFSGPYQQLIRLRYTPVGFDAQESAAIAVAGCGVDDIQLTCNHASVAGLTGAVTPAAVSMAFGNVTVGSSVFTTGFYFQNNHNMPINNVRILGLSTAPYFINLSSDGCTNSTLQPGQFCYFTVKYSPPFVGSHQQEIRLRYSPIGYNPRQSDAIIVTGRGI